MAETIGEKIQDLNKEKFLITETARMVGCFPMTLKIWEKKGLLAFEVHRDANERRRYSKAQIAQMRVIWLAKNPE